MTPRRRALLVGNTQPTVDPVKLLEGRSVQLLRVPRVLTVRHAEATGGKSQKLAANNKESVTWRYEEV